MAKSMRSKVKRKMRAIKRDKYAPRELVRLKKTLEKKGSNADVEMMKSDLVTVTGVKKIQEDLVKKQEAMEVDKQRSKFNTKTMLDVNGQFPEWMGKKARLHSQKMRKTKGKKSQKW